MRRIATFVFLITVLLLAACASKPDAEIADTQKSLDGAKNSEADIYAAEAYQAASDAMNAATAEIAAQDANSSFSRNYDKAKELLGQAKSQAETAASAAAANKEKVKVEAEAAQVEAQASIETAKAALAKAPKGKGTRADLEALGADLTAAETSLNDAKSAYASGKFMDALNQANAVREKADAVAADIQQATQKKKVS